MKFRPDNHKMLNGSKGFSLIEVLIAIVVLSIGIFAVGRFQTSAIKGDFQADKLTRSCSKAANQTEDLLRITYVHPDLDVTAPHNQATPCEQFCLEWDVTEEVPLLPLSHDSNGMLLPSPRYTAKSIEIRVFDSLTGNRRISLDTVRPRNF